MLRPFKSLISFSLPVSLLHTMTPGTIKILHWIPLKVVPGTLVNLIETASDTGEGNGNPLQCSCLENPRDRGAQ